jgi:hypothetical protein
MCDLTYCSYLAGAQIPFLGSEGYFRFLPLQVYFSCSIYNFRSINISHDHTDFGVQIPLLGFEGFYSPFWPLKLFFFFIYTKFLMDWWVTWPTKFLNPPVPSLEISWIPKMIGLRTRDIKVQTILRL